MFQTQTLFWKSELSHCLHSGNEAGWKRKNTLSKLLPHVCVSCIRINVVFRWHIETINKMQLLYVNICLCSPVSRYCESQHHVVRVLIAWCGVDVLACNLPACYNKTPITHKHLQQKDSVHKNIMPQSMAHLKLYINLHQIVWRASEEIFRPTCAPLRASVFWAEDWTPHIARHFVPPFIFKTHYWFRSSGTLWAFWTHITWSHLILSSVVDALQ